MSILDAIDCYKLDHRNQYPKGTTLVFSNWTPRKSFYGDEKDIVFFGLQYFIKKYLIEEFDKFFASDIDLVCSQYESKAKRVLNVDSFDTSHIRALHTLGYLPLEIRAIPEGSHSKIGVPELTMHNTVPEFFWLVNYLETLMSATIWMPSTNATKARQYYRNLVSYGEKTGADVNNYPYAVHDFSFRGMSSLESASISGMAHLIYFDGTDSYPSIDFVEKYYGGVVGSSVVATEHSVMCSNGKETEFETYERLLEQYPTGVLSIVSDTWDYWNVIDNYLPRLKERLLKRDGKLVLRGDSGNPVDILYQTVLKLWDIFGGTINSEGYKVLHPCIGTIYGDSITVERQNAIYQRLTNSGFCISNVVLGVGSFSYQFNTRDVYGHAMKATYIEANGESIEIFKDPKTDDGQKKSARGLLRVVGGDLEQQITWGELKTFTNDLRLVYANGRLLSEITFDEVRANARK
jgi:nicotinamide phosphoribosyltransferase